MTTIDITTTERELQEQQRQQALTTRECPRCFGGLFLACGRLGCQDCGFSVSEHERPGKASEWTCSS